MKLRHLQLWGIMGPLLFMACWMATYLFHTQTGTTIELAIRGFDPRDLLAGHYLRYTVDYKLSERCPEKGETCLCVQKGTSSLWEGTRFNSCNRLTDCEVQLRGQCNFGTFKAGIERYYFSEKFTKQLRIVPPNSSIKVAIGKNGKGVVTDLLVEGQPVKEWLEIK